VTPCSTALLLASTEPALALDSDHHIVAEIAEQVLEPSTAHSFGPSARCRGEAERDHRDKVADDAGEHATVPHRVGPSADVASIDGGAGGIGKPTETEEQKRQRRNGANHLVARADEQPSDGKIEADKGAVMGLGQEQLEGDARQCEGPDPAQQTLVKRAANAGGEGRVGAGNEQEDRRMIEIPQQRTPLRRLQRKEQWVQATSDTP